LNFCFFCFKAKEDIKREKVATLPDLPHSFLNADFQTNLMKIKSWPAVYLLLIGALLLYILGLQLLTQTFS
jgi:hypothetical protein